MKTAPRLLVLSVLASGALFTTSTLACSIAAWEQPVGANATAGDPLADGINRFAGKCGLEVTGTGHVLDNTPDGETTFIARFYFLGTNMNADGPHTIFRATSDDGGAGNEMFNVTYDDGSITVDATAPGGSSTIVAGERNKWNIVEVHWTSGGNGSVWVNADAVNDTESATFTSGTGSVSSVELGAISDMGSNTALFDDYVSHRSLPVGSLLAGDANGNGSLTIADAIAMFNELNGTLTSGQPDCNINGSVTIADAICLFNNL